MRISDWISDVCSSDLAACQRGRERIEFRGCFADKLFVEVPRQMEAVAERSDTRDQFAIARPRGHFDEQPGGSVGIVAILRIWRRAPARGRRKRRAQQNEVEFELVAIFGLGRSEERRVGKGCDSMWRSRWSPYHKKK